MARRPCRPWGDLYLSILPDNTRHTRILISNEDVVLSVVVASTDTRLGNDLTRPNANSWRVSEHRIPLHALPFPPSQTHSTSHLVRIDDEDFEDLFSEADLLPGSTQRSRTNAAANMSYAQNIDDDEPDQLDGVSSTRVDTDVSAHWQEKEDPVDQDIVSALQPK